MKKLGKILVVATALFSIGAAHASTNKTYRLLDKATTGTNIPSVVATSPVPFHLNYQKLSDEQKEIFRSKYDNLDANITPPFPSRGLRTIYKPIIKAHRSIGGTGTLKLTAIVNAQGTVESVVVHESPNEALSRRATSSLSKTQFDAATCDGESCEMTFPFEIKFQ